jgi:CheY-like chemotaxis protein
MDVSRISRGVIELRRAPVELAEVITRSIEATRAELQARGQRLDSQLAACDAVIDGDLHRLAQVFSNLLTNSAKYSENGSEIRLTALTEGDEAVISIADEGVGIPPEDRDRVFEMFSQVKSHVGRAAGGLGIGLSLVRTLVDLHGGTVSVSSPGLGLGSTFTVRLPRLAQGVEPTARETPERNPHDANAPLRIMVVDDNEDAAESLQALLELDGHSLLTATSARHAIEQFDAFAPDLVFMDVGMPEVDGVEATRRIRSRPNGEAPFIVALTGWGQEHDRARTQEAGADLHVVKPISAEELDSVLALARQRHGQSLTGGGRCGALGALTSTRGDAA